MMMFKSVKPHFFRIILDDNTRDRKLGIPGKFVMEYGDCLPDVVFLKVPSGEVWEVEVRKGDGVIWLEKGWQEFADYYSLENGYLLVFEYDRNQQYFYVLIFDMSTTEIDYPFSNENPDLEVESREPMAEETEADAFVGYIDDHFSPCQKRKETSPLGDPQPHKKKRLNATRQFGSTNVDTSATPNGTPSSRNTAAHIGSSGKSRVSGLRLDAATGCSQTLTLAEKARVLCSARDAFRSTNPFFMVALQPSYIGKRLALPTNFCTKYIKMKCGNVILCDLGGRAWSVKYCIRLGPNGKPIAEFLNGWRKFIKDNYFVVGDVCVFELTSDTKISFNVVFFRVARDESYRRELGEPSSVNLVKDEEDEKSSGKQFIQKHSCSRALGITAIANEVASMPPIFRVIIQLSHLKRHDLSVPMWFISQYIKEGTKSIILQVENRCWPVKLNRYSNQGKLSGGWKKFTRENSLHLGDICVFEATENDTMQLKVSIFRDGNPKQVIHKDGASKQYTAQRPSSSVDPTAEDSSTYA